MIRAIQAIAITFVITLGLPLAALAEGTPPPADPDHALPFDRYVATLDEFRNENPMAELSPEPTVAEVVAAIEALLVPAETQEQWLSTVVPEPCYASAHEELLAYWRSSIELYQTILPELAAAETLSAMVPVIESMDEDLRSRHPAAYVEASGAGGGLQGSASNILDVLATCEPAQEASSSPATAPPAWAPLAEAVRFSPMSASLISFNDWASMKRLHGFGGVTSATPLGERMDAWLEIMDAESPAAVFAIGTFRVHAASWGWDTTDLDWEASFSAGGPPVAVLRFREGFDLGSVMERFDARDFSTEAYGDATIRSHGPAGAAWISDSDFGVLNTAFLDDGRTLVLSSGIDGVKAVLDARKLDFVRAPAAWVVADALGEPLWAGIELGLGKCELLDPRVQPSGKDGANEALLEEVGPLGVWEGMGVGTYRDGGTLTGRFVFAYGRPEDAASDLAGRVRLAEEAISSYTGDPYAESSFRVMASVADGATIDLEVKPVDGAHQLRSAFTLRDLVFATCG